MKITRFSAHKLLYLKNHARQMYSYIY